MNLVILYPDYLFRGDAMTLPSSASGYDAENVITGSRQEFYRASSNVNRSSWPVDCSPLENEERVPDYLYLGGLNLAIAKSDSASMSVYLKGSTDNMFSVSTFEQSEADLTLGDLYGRKPEDYVMEISGASQKRYWRGRIETGGSGSDFKHELRKMYFGQWWYPDCEPDVPKRLTVSLDGERAQRRTLRLRWRGITNADLFTFTEKILKHRAYNPVVLYTRTWHSILNSERVFHCWITSFEHERSVHNRNNISVEFSEVL